MKTKSLTVVESDGSTTTLYPQKEFKRLDVGYPVPDDGGTYVMVQHELLLFGETRHSYNGTTKPIPAVANRDWGIETLAKPNGDYHPVPDTWQWWFYHFWDWASGYRLPAGEHIGTHVNPRNPRIVYDIYTPGRPG